MGVSDNWRIGVTYSWGFLTNGVRPGHHERGGLQRGVHLVRDVDVVGIIETNRQLRPQAAWRVI